MKVAKDPLGLKVTHQWRFNIVKKIVVDFECSDKFVEES